MTGTPFFTWTCCRSYGLSSVAPDGDNGLDGVKATADDVTHASSSTTSIVRLVEDDRSDNVAAELLPPPIPPPRPALHREAMELLTGALLIYTFSDLREIARRGELPHTALADLEPPIALERVLAAIQANKKQLLQTDMDHQGIEERLSTLYALKQDEACRMNDTSRTKRRAVLTHFHDMNSGSEMVHGIVVNHEAQRVTVIFRGSVTQQDFITDARVHQKVVDNPVTDLSMDKSGVAAAMSETINVHTGFYEYLFHTNDVLGQTRLVRILDNVLELLVANPTYRVYLTGHSLGGALATLCGFYAACRDALVQNGPVTVVSIASPLVGNLDFRTAFQTLEKSQRLQHLRIANKEDMVTLLPFAAPKATLLSPVLAAALGAGNLYKHVGIRLKLKSAQEVGDTRPYSISYAKDLGHDDAYSQEIKRAFSAGKTLVGSLMHVIKVDFAKAMGFHRYVVGVMQDFSVLIGYTTRLCI